MVQADPEPASEAAFTKIVPRMKKMPESNWQAVLQTSALGLIRVDVAMSESLPGFPRKRTWLDTVCILKCANGGKKRTNEQPGPSPSPLCKRAIGGLMTIEAFSDA